MNIRALCDFGKISPYPVVVNVDITKYNKVRNRSFFSFGNPVISSSVANLNNTNVVASIKNTYANNTFTNNIF